MRLLALVLALWQVQQGAALTGVVVRAGTQTPVEGARVLIVSHTGGAGGVRIAVADGDGRFRFVNLPAGVLRVWAERESYVRPAPLRVTLEAGEPVRSLTLEMVPTGVITGRVLDGSAEPVARVDVRADNGERTWEARTNDLGEYRLFGLPPGAYVVSAAPYLPPRIERGTYVRPTPPSPFSRGEGQFMMPLARMLEAGEYVDPRALAGTGQARVFYPGTRDADAAALLEVKPGETLAAIDVVLR